MAETRVQIAYHFKIDPAQMVPGQIRLPEQIIRTVTVGEEFNTEKVGMECLSLEDRARLVMEIDKQCREMTRTAQAVADGNGPAGPAAFVSADGEAAEEMSAF